MAWIIMVTWSSNSHINLSCILKVFLHHHDVWSPSRLNYMQVSVSPTGCEWLSPTHLIFLIANGISWEYQKSEGGTKLIQSDVLNDPRWTPTVAYRTHMTSMMIAYDPLQQDSPKSRALMCIFGFVSLGLHLLPVLAKQWSWECSLCATNYSS